MQQEHERQQSISATPSIRDRVGVFIQPTNAVEALSWIREAEQAGVHHIWMDWGAGFAETLTLFAAVAVQTERIGLGTAIIPTYPRHPLVLAQQALALHDLAPGRFRLGIGSGHRLFMEHWYGLASLSPQSYLKEYLEIVRAVLWEGNLDYHGTFFQVVVNQAMYPFPRQAPIPLLISAIGTRAFRLAGEIADGALSALCPVPYLLDKAFPALHAGAEARGRSAPPIIAHIPWCSVPIRPPPWLRCIPGYKLLPISIRSRGCLRKLALLVRYRAMRQNWKRSYGRCWSVAMRQRCTIVYRSC
jgi:alkanesulfonate monooxygenase SsuD/methylene tetrahydromethanopterin reductase-like flavin-dependent oxidoreductase (luciferase family)